MSQLKRRRLLFWSGVFGVAWGLGCAPWLIAQTSYPSRPIKINRLLESPELRERLSAEALEPMPMSPAEFGQYIRDDIARWTRLAKERHIELE